QHDGTQQLLEENVRALSSLGGSTKGLADVGFMGIGFKSVFARFRIARVSGFRWQFRFTIRETRGELGQRKREWSDALRPYWGDSGPTPDPGFTTVFRLEAPLDHERMPAEDFELLATQEDPTP